MPKFTSAIMPALLDEEKTPITDCTMFTAETCVNEVLKYCNMNKINTAVPKIDKGQDLLIEVSHNVWKSVQVKKVVYEQKKLNYKFKFQRSGATHSSTGSSCTSYSAKDIDIFYFVFLTKYRTLIWELESQHVPINDRGVFTAGTNIVLDRDKKASDSYVINKLKLVYTSYHEEIFKQRTTFFIPSSSISAYI
jgi:hypothetical protein